MFIFVQTNKQIIMKREFLIWMESGYDFSKTFKTEELAENYAKKMNYENYEIRITYQMTRK